MDSATGFLTQSKFYSPAFNAAIFDGPIKIYFSQAHESLALKLYFQLQKKIRAKDFNVKDESANTLFVMLYPSEESFYNSFDKKSASEIDSSECIVSDNLGDDHVIGVRGPITENSLEAVHSKIKNFFQNKLPSFLEEGVEALA